MGWIIFGILTALLLLPLFIPITLRAKWNKDIRDWTVHVGPLIVAPNPTEHLARYRDKLKKIFHPLAVVINLLFSFIVLIFRSLFWFIRQIFWPFRAISSAIRKLREKKPREMESSGWDVHETPSLPESEDEGEIPKEDEKEAEEIDETLSDDDRTVDNGISPGQDEIDDGEMLIAFDDEEEESEKEAPEEDETSEKKGKLGKFFDMIAKFRELAAIYVPPGKKALRAVILFMTESMRTLTWRVFDLRLRTGGDPVLLGTLLGWHYALTASINPNLSNHLVFEPDFYDPEPNLEGSAHIVLVVWPYRFVLPTLRFLVRLPWISMIRIARKQFKKG